MTDFRKDNTQAMLNSARKGAKVILGEGYIPHDGMRYFTCPYCGFGEFRSYPQTIPTDGGSWTYEYHCVRCGRMTGLTVRRTTQ